MVGSKEKSGGGDGKKTNYPTDAQVREWGGRGGEKQVEGMSWEGGTNNTIGPGKIIGVYVKGRRKGGMWKGQGDEEVEVWKGKGKEGREATG